MPPAGLAPEIAQVIDLVAEILLEQQRRQRLAENPPDAAA